MTSVSASGLARFGLPDDRPSNDYERGIYEWAQAHWPDVPGTWAQCRAYYIAEWHKSQAKRITRTERERRID